MKIVSVQKGAGSASAGIGATSGSIVAKTLDAKDLLKDGRQFGFKVNAGYSSNEGHSKGATAFGKAQNVDFLTSLNFTNEENFKAGKGYQATDGSNVVKNSALGQRALLAKLGFDINDDHRVVVSHRQERNYGERALREEFDFSQSWTVVNNAGQRQSWIARGYNFNKIGNDYYLVDQNGDLVPYTDNNSPSYRVTTTDTTNLEYTGKNIGFINNIDANVYRTLVNRETTSDNSRTRVITNGANLNLDTYIGESHAIKYGVNWRNQEGRPNTLLSGLNYQKKDELGAYVEGIWGIKNFTLTTGLRYDHFDFKAMDGKKISGDNFNPSLGLIYEVTNDFSLNANWNYATRSPRLYEPMIAGGEGRRGRSIISVSKDLKAEKARDVEVGFNYNLNDMLAVNGSYFWKKIKDVHALTDADATGYREIYNGGVLNNKGYELGATFRYAGFTVKAGVADSKPELEGSALDINTLAVLIGRTWTASLAYQFENPNIELGWRGRFIESEKGTPSRGSSNSDSEINRPGYGVNDLFATWKPTKDLNVNFAVNNVFNKYYKSHSQRTGANSLPGVGRDFRVNVNYTF